MITAFIKKIEKSVRSRYKTSLTRSRAFVKSKRKRFVKLGNPTVVIWIFGCQRSGTTFLEKIFRHDLDSEVFGEFSELTIAERKTVLRKPEELVKIVSSKNAKYAVIRPLFESDRALALMDLFPNSVGVWMFRNCEAVVNSMVNKWDDKFFSISKKVESDQNNFWRLEKVLQPLINEISHEKLNDVYAKYWVIRNTIPLEKKLIEDPRILFLEYNQLAMNPKESIKTVLNHTKKINIWKGFKSNARTDSINKNLDLKLASDITTKTSFLYQKLHGVSKKQFGL